MAPNTQMLYQPAAYGLLLQTVYMHVALLCYVSVAFTFGTA